MHFGLAVSNLVDNLKAANHFGKSGTHAGTCGEAAWFPATRLGRVKTKHQTATLETFGEFMTGLVTAASEVSFNLPGFSTSQIHTVTMDFRNGKNGNVVLL